MDYFCLIQSVLAFIEGRIAKGNGAVVLEDGLAPELEVAIGVSYAHLREVFKECTGMSLGRYLLYRRVSKAAFEMAHGDRPLLDIALDCGFDNPDTFTRAFRRFVGMTPSGFRKARIEVGRIKLTGGIFGPGLAIGREGPSIPLIPEEHMQETRIEKTMDGCVLYGVPRVWYGPEGITPLPSVLRSVFNYLGQDIRYTRIMAASGAAFRLRWNPGRWDGGNVDTLRIYQRPEETIERALAAAGRSFRILRRGEGVGREDFEAFIRAEIDEGRPVVAFGIIGPPEACIVAGYREGGRLLLGWNFFQENPEFAASSTVDPSGYFSTSAWWENPSTTMLLSVGEGRGRALDDRDVLSNALEVLRRERIGPWAGGRAAFDAWARDLSDESQFPKGAPLPLLFERLMCENDALAMIGEGRYHAAAYMETVAARLEGEESPDAGKLALRARAIGGLFRKEYELTQGMAEAVGGWLGGEECARRLADPAARAAIVPLILEARDLDGEAAKGIEEVLAAWR